MCNVAKYRWKRGFVHVCCCGLVSVAQALCSIACCGCHPTGGLAVCPLLLLLLASYIAVVQYCLLWLLQGSALPPPSQ